MAELIFFWRSAATFSAALLALFSAAVSAAADRAEKGRGTGSGGRAAAVYMLTRPTPCGPPTPTPAPVPMVSRDGSAGGSRDAFSAPGLVLDACTQAMLVAMMWSCSSRVMAPCWSFSVMMRARDMGLDALAPPPPPPPLLLLLLLLPHEEHAGDAQG